MQQNCVFSITWNQLNQKFLRFASFLHNSTFWSIIVLKLKRFSCPLLMRATEVSKLLLFRSKCLWISGFSGLPPTNKMDIFVGEENATVRICTTTRLWWQKLWTRATQSHTGARRACHTCVHRSVWRDGMSVIPPLRQNPRVIRLSTKSQRTAMLQDASLPCKKSQYGVLLRYYLISVWRYYGLMRSFGWIHHYP